MESKPRYLLSTPPYIDSEPARHDSVLAVNRNSVAQRVCLLEIDKDVAAQSSFPDEELRHVSGHLHHPQLKSRLELSQEISLVSAKVVDIRVTYKHRKKFVEYKLQVKTHRHGTLYVWRRYSAFRRLAANLETKSGYKSDKIPALPKKLVFGNFSKKKIQGRVIQLNQFLEEATSDKNLQWGIRIDNNTCVYKRRVKSPTAKEHWRPEAWETQEERDDMAGYAKFIYQIRR